jgi:hypothetical protein
MSKTEIIFQSVKVAIGIFLAFMVFGYVHPAQKLGSVYGNPSFDDYTSATLATTTLAAFPGILHTIVVATPIANSVITVYDSASSTTASTTVAKITIPSTAPAPFSLSFDNSMYSGLTVAQSGATSTLTAEYQQN